MWPGRKNSILFLYTSIGKTGVISEMAILFRFDGEPEAHCFSSESGRKRRITASKSRDIWKALYISMWIPSRLNNAYVLLYHYRMSIIRYLYKIHTHMCFGPALILRSCLIRRTIILRSLEVHLKFWSKRFAMISNKSKKEKEKI